MYEEALMMTSTVVEGSSAESVGARLKRLRLQRGFSQRDLSSPGVSYAYISRIEAGARTPSVKALRKLAQKLGVSVEYLETGKDIREVDDRELRLADAEHEHGRAEAGGNPRGGLRGGRYDVGDPGQDRARSRSGAARQPSRSGRAARGGDPGRTGATATSSARPLHDTWAVLCSPRRARPGSPGVRALSQQRGGGRAR